MEEQKQLNTPNANEIMQADKERVVAQRGAELLAGRMGAEMPQESPIEEARRLNQETKTLFQNLSQINQNLEKQTANLMMGGQSFAGQQQTPKETPEQEARRKGKELVDGWFKR